MTSLESYLRDEYQKDKQQLKWTQDAIRKVAPIFVAYRTEFHDKKFQNKIRTWPYRVVNGNAEKVHHFSDSTHCMILFALDAILQGTGELPQNVDGHPILYPAKVRVPKLQIEGLSEFVQQATSDMIDLLHTRIPPRVRSDTPFVTSSTFGNDVH